MAVGGVLGNGSKCGYSLNSPLSYTKIGQLMNIPTFISLLVKDIDTTVYSTSNVMTYMPGMIDPPEIVLELLADLDPATGPTHEALRLFQSAGTTLYFRIEVPVNHQQTLFRAWEYQAYVREFTPSIPIADKQTIKLTMKFAGGLIVFVPAASLLA